MGRPLLIYPPLLGFHRQLRFAIWTPAEVPGRVLSVRMQSARLSFRPLGHTSERKPTKTSIKVLSSKCHNSGRTGHAFAGQVLSFGEIGIIASKSFQRHLGTLTLNMSQTGDVCSLAPGGLQVPFPDSSGIKDSRNIF